jgi:hypothetical protein
MSVRTSPVTPTPDICRCSLEGKGCRTWGGAHVTCHPREKNYEYRTPPGPGFPHVVAHVAPQCPLHSLRVARSYGWGLASFSSHTSRRSASGERLSAPWRRRNRSTGRRRRRRRRRGRSRNTGRWRRRLSTSSLSTTSRRCECAGHIRHIVMGLAGLGCVVPCRVRRSYTHTHAHTRTHTHTHTHTHTPWRVESSSRGGSHIYQLQNLLCE